MTSDSITPKPPSAELKATSVSQPPSEHLPSPPSRQSYGAGDCIGGKYILESLLGRGGMGEVWTASNETLAVQRAVKLIRSEADSRENTDRLLHEARAAARLADPAIVRVFDFGKTQYGDPFLVMEVLRGEDLASAIRRKERLSAARAVRILLPVIRALGLAHLHGIVHRDLKPENIFLTKSADGRIQPKLLDFGIAKLKDMRSLRLTIAGSVMGSPLYMAPEQARGEEVDERADIWALCVVLYEVISGEPPFLGESRAEVFAAAIRSTPASLVETGLCDNALWSILLQGLSKNAKDRYQSMQDLGQALAHWLLGQEVFDDITGASLEAAWFRESPQSFLSSTVPPGRPSMSPPVRSRGGGATRGMSPPGNHAESSPPTRSEYPIAGTGAGIVSEPPDDATLLWPTWLRAPRQRWIAGAGLLGAALIPWLLTAQRPAAPVSAANLETTAPSHSNSTEQTVPAPPAHSPREPLRNEHKQGGPAFLAAEIPNSAADPEQPDASAPIASQPALVADEPTAAPPAPPRKRSVSTATSARDARHRAKKKRRSRLMDPFQ